MTATHAGWLKAEPDRRWRRVEGTLVFADVSGFTAMTERLARRGRQGAEETLGAVNRVFAALRGGVAGQGGEILKFGGDAVLALFVGEAHAARGAAAALDMQAAMRPLRRLRTAAGTVELKLSMGVASGDVDLFLSSDAPPELIVAGPLATEVVRCESAAEGGQVIVSPATAAALPPECLGPPAGPGVELVAAAACPALVAPAMPDGFDVLAALPGHLREADPGDGEHRSAAVSFVQVKGVDALCDQDPERLADALDDLMRSVQRACDEHGITIVATDVDADGLKVLLVAGAPVASPDDDDELLHAVRAILATPSPLTLRAGANRGGVFASAVGTEDQRFWTTMGDTVNLGARVMAKAAPGQLLITPSIAGRLRDPFECTPVEPFMVKGKSAPVHALAVGALRGERDAAAVPAARLVGREKELAVIAAAIAAAERGDRRVIELVGEPGIGKSTLVDAATEMAGNLLVIRIAGGPYAARSPYRALLGPLRRLLGIDAEEPTAVEQVLRERVDAFAPQLQPWLPLLGLPLGLELAATPETRALGSEFARQRLNVVLGQLVAALLPPRAVMLVVEDTHWLDGATADFLAHAARQSRPGHGNVVLATRRATGASLFEGELLELAPLDAGAAATLVAAADGEHALPRAARERLVERAGGNPLLLGELVAAVRAGQPLDTLPDSVETLVTARIDTLPRAQRLVLRQAAVLGVRVSLDVLDRLLGPAATRDGLDDFLVDDEPGVVRFRHALLRDAAYESLSYRRRHELHAHAAELIERDAQPMPESQAELLALHFHAAGRWPETWRYGRAAAEQALGRAAPQEAAAFFDWALQAARSLPGIRPAELAVTAERRGDAEALAGRAEAAIAAYQAARRHMPEDPVHRAELYFKEGRLRENARSIADALRCYTRGLTALEGAPDGRSARAARGRLVLAHGAARMRGGRLREALPYLERAVKVGRAADDRATVGHAYYVLEAVHTDLGTGEAERFRGLALPIFEALEDHSAQARVHNNLGASAYVEGRWDEAVQAYEAARTCAGRVGDVREEALASANIAEIRCDQGRLDEAEELLHDVLATMRSTAFLSGAGYVMVLLGRVAVRRGELERAREWYASASVTLYGIGAEAHLLDVDAREAERLLVAGEPAAALHLVGLVRERARQLGAPRAQLSMLQRIAAEAKAALGDRSGARERLLEAIELARSVDADFDAALAREALGRLGDAEAARAARATFDRLGVLA